MRKVWVGLSIVVLGITCGFSNGNCGRTSDFVKLETEQQSMLESEKLESALYDEQTDTYPGYYGGCYINDDSELVVLVTDNSESVKGAIQEYSGNSEVLIQSVEYSYNELCVMCNMISDYYENNYMEQENILMREMVQSIALIEIDVVHNCVVVGINELTDEKKDVFAEYITNSDFVRLEEQSFVVLC